MGLSHSPRTITDGLVLCLDAGNTKSYPGSGTSWNDLSGNNRKGTLTNGPTYNSANGGSIVFDGTNDYVRCNSTNGFGTINSQPTISLGIWANVSRKGTGTFAYQQLAGFRNNLNFDFYFLLLDSTQATVLTEARIRTSSGDWGIYIDGTAIFDNWTYIMVTANVNRIDLYLNGVLSGSNTNVTGSFGSTSSNFDIGKNSADSAGGGQSWQVKGNIAQVSVYNRALTAAEVQQNYNALKGRYV